jgi:predicted nucleic-acid-binding Zn-ribbon protein
METCQVCGYTSQEVRIVNNLCSVHTCEKCGAEGYASGDVGAILCEKHGGQ